MFPPIGSSALGGFSRVLADGSFLEFLNFKIQDPSPLANRQQAFRRILIREVYDLFSTRVVWSVSFYLPPRPKTFKFLGVAGGTIERSCYSPHYVNTERDYERDCQATLPQGRTAGSRRVQVPSRP